MWRGQPMHQDELAKWLLYYSGDVTLEEMHDWLCNFPYLGPFMAYEIVTDLSHTHLLNRAADIMTWASPGPGAARGAGRLVYWDPDRLSYERQSDRAEILEIMQHLLKESRASANWPPQLGQWTMREVEHTLCEFDKYERARLCEGRPKQRFAGGSHVDQVKQRAS